MIGIEVNGKMLDVYEKSSLRIRLKNIIFDGYDVTKVYGSFTFPMRLPMTKKNRIILGFPERPDQYDRMMHGVEVKVSYNGLPITDGLMTIKKVDPSAASIKISVGNMGGLKGVSLKDLNLGNHSEASAAAMVDHARDTVLHPENHDWIFTPVLNQSYFNDIDRENQNITQMYGIYHNRWENGAFVNRENDEIVTPFLKFDFIIKKIFEKIGYTVDNDWMDAEMNKLLLYNVGNLYNKTGNSGGWKNSFDLVDFVPDKKVSDLLKGVMGVFDLGLFPDFSRKNVKITSIKTIRNAPARRDWTKYATQTWEKTDFLGDVSSIGYEVDESDELREEYPYVNVPDCDASTPPGQRCYDYNLNDVRIRIYVGGQWVPLQKVYKRIVFGEGRPALHKLSPLYMNKTSTMPHCKVVRTSNPGLRMLLYRGMIDGQPFANNHIFDGGVIRDDWKYSLLWNGEKGIYNTWHGSNATRRKKIQRDFLLPLRELINFDFEQKVVVDNVEYIVSKLDVVLTNGGDNRVMCNTEMITA